MRQLAVDFDVTALLFDRRDPALRRNVALQDRLDALAPYASVMLFPSRLCTRQRAAGLGSRAQPDRRPALYLLPARECTIRGGAEEGTRGDPFRHRPDRQPRPASFRSAGAAPPDRLHPSQRGVNTASPARGARKGIRSWYIRYQAGSCLAPNPGWLDRFDVNVTVSDVDPGVLRQLAPSARFEVVPNGVDADFFRPAANGQRTDASSWGAPPGFLIAMASNGSPGDVLPRMRAAGVKDAVKWVGRITDSERIEFSSPGLSFTGYVERHTSARTVGGVLHCAPARRWRYPAKDPRCLGHGGAGGGDPGRRVRDSMRCTVKTCLIADDADDFVRAHGPGTAGPRAGDTYRGGRSRRSGEDLQLGSGGGAPARALSRRPEPAPGSMNR